MNIKDLSNQDYKTLLDFHYEKIGAMERAISTFKLGRDSEGLNNDPNIIYMLAEMENDLIEAREDLDKVRQARA